MSSARSNSRSTRSWNPARWRSTDPAPRMPSAPTKSVVGLEAGPSGRWVRVVRAGECQRSTAASETVLAIGPGVSCVCEIGTTPERLTSPTVGLMPTIPFTEDGHTNEAVGLSPDRDRAQVRGDGDPGPELDPHGLRSSAYGLRHSRPGLQPLDARVERKFAHSDRFALPSITAPASRILSTRTRRASEDLAERERARRGLHPVCGVDVVLDQDGIPAWLLGARRPRARRRAPPRCRAASGSVSSTVPSSGRTPQSARGTPVSAPAR